MMPLSVAALISGMLTLGATAPNLIVNAELERKGLEGFAFFSFTPFGLPVLVLGILYMILVRRRLPDTATPASSPRRSNLATWIDEYKLIDREHRLRITARSPLAGRTLDEADLSGWSGASVVVIERSDGFAREVMQPTARTELQAGDILLIDYAASEADIRSICERFALEEIPLRGADFADRSQEIGLAEVIVAPTSDLVGKTIAGADLRARSNLTVIGLRRGIVAHGREYLHEPLAIGDTLRVIGPWRELEKLRSDDSPLLIIGMAAERDAVRPAPQRAVYALGCLALVVGLMVSGVIPNVQAALIGCLLMGVLRCIDFNGAYRSIDWKTIVLIVGMLPFSIALERTGGVDLAADSLHALTAGTGPHVVLATLFATTAVLGMFISNTATAVLMAPVALAVAQELGASPYPFAMIVALAASTAFMTPVSSPVNTLVVAPGHYTFGDFVRIGVPFSLIVLIVSVILVPWLLPL
jgi:di/tricarboxylate transporter